MCVSAKKSQSLHSERGRHEKETEREARSNYGRVATSHYVALETRCRFSTPSSPYLPLSLSLSLSVSLLLCPCLIWFFLLVLPLFVASSSSSCVALTLPLPFALDKCSNAQSQLESCENGIVFPLHPLLHHPVGPLLAWAVCKFCLATFASNLPLLPLPLGQPLLLPPPPPPPVPPSLLQPPFFFFLSVLLLLLLLLLLCFSWVCSQLVLFAVAKRDLWLLHIVI